METDFSKLNDFIAQLLNSSAIKNQFPHEKEESVMAFINQNEAKLSQTFAAPEYYPTIDWQTLKKELLSRVGDIITEQLKPVLKSIIYDSLTLGWKRKYKDFMISDEQFKDQLFELTSKLIGRYNSRKHYGAVLNFMTNNVVAPFLTVVYDNKRYIANGLIRFDEISLETPEEAIDAIYTGVLLLPLYDVTLPVKVVMPQYSGQGNKSVSYKEVESNGVLRQNFLGKIKEIMLKEFPNISPYFMNIILKTFYLPEETESVPYVAKIMKIIYNFAVAWKRIKKDRGAESFEASWLNVARINYKFYSYDLGTLDEFYKITIEEDL